MILGDYFLSCQEIFLSICGRVLRKIQAGSTENLSTLFGKNVKPFPAKPMDPYW